MADNLDDSEVILTEPQSAHKSNMSSRRGSLRVKKSALSVEISQAINAEMENIEDFWQNENSKVQMESFSDDVERVFEEIKGIWNELDSLTTNKEKLETLRNVFGAYEETVLETIKALKEKIQELEEQNAAEDEEDSEDERELQEALERFQQLVARRKARNDKKKTQTGTTPDPWPQAAQRNEMDGQSRSQPPDHEVIKKESSGEIQALTHSLIATMKATKRSTLEPGVFTGDHTTFREWEIDFDAYVESEGLTGVQPLRHLKRFVSGKALDAISGYFLTSTIQAYKDARRDLTELFGRTYDAAVGLRKKLEEFPKIGPKDAEQVRKYSNLLTHVKSAMIDCEELKILNDRSQNEALTRKSSQNG